MKLIEDPKTLAERIVNVVCEDIYGRSGGDHFFDGIDDEVRQVELIPELVAAVDAQLGEPPVQIVDGIVRPVPWSGEPPLLQCVDCRNTESPAGAMARQFNRGRCLHCGGYFRVVRA